MRLQPEVVVSGIHYDGEGRDRGGMQRIIQEDGTSEIQGKIIAALLSLITILSVGTIGYWLIGDGEYLVLDCFYMTIITISTIGFMEVIVISDNPQGRVFTIIVALGERKWRS